MFGYGLTGTIAALVGAICAAYTICSIVFLIARKHFKACLHEHQFFREVDRIVRSDGVTVAIGKHECIFCGHHDADVIVLRDLKRPTEPPGDAVPVTESQSRSGQPD